MDEQIEIGQILKKTRLKQQKTIDEIAQELRIRPRFLEALEEENYRACPSLTYAYGFLRSYAGYLNLDADTLIDELRRQTLALKKREEGKYPPPVISPQMTFPTRVVLWVGALVLILTYVVWHWALTPIEPKEAEPPVLPQEVVEPAPLVPDLTQEEIAPEAINIPAKERSPVILLSREEAAETEKKEKAKQYKTYGASKNDSDIWIVATEDSWVEITEEDTIVLSLILKENDRYYVPRSGEYFLKTGNAGGLDFYIDGEKYPALGKKGAVYSGIFLSQESLKERLEK